MTLPADIVNRSLDMVGKPDLAIGDLEEGTEAAKPALRAYGPCLRQLLRAVHWGFARKQAQLTLLADQTGQTPDVGTSVVPPWAYEYAYPIDCMKARFVPQNNELTGSGSPQGNISLPDNVPMMTNITNAPTNGWRLMPARFLVALDFNYPVVVGGPQPWGSNNEWWAVSGEGPVQRTVVLTNVKQASLVYTALVLYPDEWDVLFQEAMVQLLAAHLAMPLWKKDPKFGLTLQAQAIAKAKSAITEARIADGNESTAVSDITVDWMRARNAGGGSWWGGGQGSGWDGPGVFGYGYDSCAMPSGAAF